MDVADMLMAQLTDPFRLGLVVALVATMLRTEAVTGRWLPLALGVLFVAVVIPLTTGRAAGEPLALLVGVGIVATVAHLALVLAVRHVVLRWLA